MNDLVEGTWGRRERGRRDERDRGTEREGIGKDKYM